MNQDEYFTQYGLSTWLYLHQPLEEALTRIGGTPFRTVEIWANGAHLDPSLRPDLQEVKALLDKFGLRVHSLHAPAERELRIGDPNPALRPRWMERVAPCLEYAARLGAMGVVVHVSTLRERLAPKVYEDGCRASTEFVYRLRERARALGVSLLLENMVRWGWPRFGSTLTELAQMFPDDDFRFCLDTGHAAINRVSQAAEMAAAGRRLASVHASNNDGQSDLHLLPTDGVIHWPEVTAALAGNDYRHPIILEINGQDDPDGILRRLEGLWRQL